MTTAELNLSLIRRTVALGASEDDFDMFIEQCKRTGLDPLSRQINFMLRRGKNAKGEWVQKGSTIVSIDGARLIAARTGLYNGSTTWWCGEDLQWVDVWLANTPPSASKTSIIRSIKDRSYGDANFTGVALWKEYGANAYGPLWKSMPSHMLGKCSEMLALRKAFPAELSGLYSSDEMTQSENNFQPAPAESNTIAVESNENNEASPTPLIDLICKWARDWHPEFYALDSKVKDMLRNNGVTALGKNTDMNKVHQILNDEAARYYAAKS